MRILLKFLKLKNRYEDFHNVKYSSGALKAAAELSARFISDRKLPDKAIDVLDEVAASIQLKPKKSDVASKINVDMVQKVVAKMARIPQQKINSSDRDKLENLNPNLRLKFSAKTMLLSLYAALFDYQDLDLTKRG